MSRTRAYSQDTIDVMMRFFEAFDRCVELKLVKSISSFCVKNCIDKRHLYAQRKDMSKGLFHVGWLLPLIRDCNVSASWLMTGKGTMFVQ